MTEQQIDQTLTEINEYIRDYSESDDDSECICLMDTIESEIESLINKKFTPAQKKKLKSTLNKIDLTAEFHEDELIETF